ncbi:MarR family winged helix-turn-helix transcriptional regulator [Bdellovibrio sp. BCCA]|uniref:MarR family winged helix-turn-helix transcriptional regulator n=1 Tax=Bdellovibrio sp. BCCA TaxID=3136281 RepID=UPI0030F08342
MDDKNSANQLKAWEMLISRHSLVLRKIEKDLEQRKGVLPLHWYDVLLVLYRSPEQRLRLSEIADRIVTSRSALTRSVEKLEQEGLLTKEVCAEDKRGQYAHITSAGKKALKETWVYYKAAIEEHFGQYFTNTEAKEFQRLLEKLPSS